MREQNERHRPTEQGMTFLGPEVFWFQRNDKSRSFDKKKKSQKMKQPPQILPRSNILTKLQKIHCRQKIIDRFLFNNKESAGEKIDCCILLYTSIHSCVLFIQVRL